MAAMPVFLGAPDIAMPGKACAPARLAVIL